MTNQNQSEKDRPSATSSPANAQAEAKAPPEIVDELTNEELRSVSGGDLLANPGLGGDGKNLKIDFKN
jgi:bacteriocin-like protein